MDKVQPKEIRIVVDGGIVQQIGLGRDVPDDLRITLTDYDLDGQTKEDDERIQPSSYGDIAFCSVLRDTGDPDGYDYVDADGTRWI